MLLLSVIGVSAAPACPASCVVCSQDAVICHRLTHFIGNTSTHVLQMFLHFFFTAALAVLQPTPPGEIMHYFAVLKLGKMKKENAWHDEVNLR